MSDDKEVQALLAEIEHNEKNLQSMVDREEGPIWQEFDPYQATSILCIVNCVLNLSSDIRKVAGLLAASIERPHSGDAETRRD